jgi:prephenate dehydratase
MRVGYQGEPGAFSEQAALELIAEARPRGYVSFDELIEAVANGAIEVALLPVENSIYGTIAYSYDLLWSRPALHIIDETTFRVVQSLIGTRDARLDGIVEVRSHPVALDQCRKFLGQHANWRRRVVDDTAGAVREIVEYGDPGVAAIASAHAARTYGAQVIAEAIQDDPNNFTRFFLISRDERARRGLGHACVAMTIAHRVGSLRDALDAFAREGINLRSLVSRPSGEKPFEYRFYCEVETSDRAALERALAAIEGSKRILGVY